MEKLKSSGGISQESKQINRIPKKRLDDLKEYYNDPDYGDGLF